MELARLRMDSVCLEIMDTDTRFSEAFYISRSVLVSERSPVGRRQINHASAGDWRLGSLAD